MSFKMNFTITQDVESLVNKIRIYAQREGGTFSGNTQKGSISINTIIGTVKGRYEVNGSQCILEITDKPFLATQGMIESRIREALEKV